MKQEGCSGNWGGVSCTLVGGIADKLESDFD